MKSVVTSLFSQQGDVYVQLMTKAKHCPTVRASVSVALLNVITVVLDSLVCLPTAPQWGLRNVALPIQRAKVLLYFPDQLSGTNINNYNFGV
jgi:hypothetical protein